MPSRRGALLLTMTLTLPLAGALTDQTLDPARDVMLTRSGALVPVDSIDLLRIETAPAGDGLRAATLQLSDLSRRGLEDRLFVRSTHSLRLYGYTEVYDDLRALQLLALQMDAAPEPVVAAFLVSRDGVEELPVKARIDVANDRVSWTLAPPVRGEPTTRFAFTALQGCDDFDTCEPPTRGVAAMDVAPNDLAQPLAVLAPRVWWTDVLPEDDASVPKPPASLAGAP